MNIEKALYWFLRVFSIIVAGGGTILFGLGLFCTVTGGLPIAAICFACGVGLVGSSSAMTNGCQKLKEKM